MTNKGPFYELEYHELNCVFLKQICLLLNTHRCVCSQDSDWYLTKMCV